MSARIEIDGLARHFGTTPALAGVSLDVAAGRYCVLLGPSGCGKTTLLNILGGFTDASSGTVRIGGREMGGVPPAQRPTTTVFQDYALFPHMSLAENVAFGLRMRGMARAPRLARAAEMLALVGLAGRGRARPADLSGGQRQRVALARALAPEPDVLLLDEPLGALDLNLRRAMQEELKTLQHRVGATFVHVTHDQEEAMALADLLVVMNAGRIEDAGPPERVYRGPASRFAAAFLGEMTFVPGTVQGTGVETALGALPVAAGGPDGRRVTLGFRPEHLRPDAAHPIGRARVSETLFQGAHRRVRLMPERADAPPLLALLAPGTDIAVGAHIALAIDPAAAVIFDDDT